MVACAPWDLPYQEGTDAPCDLSAIWCQFAQVIEDQFAATDLVVNRTAVAVPFLKVAKLTTTEVTPPIGFEQAIGVAFDAVYADNDNMVDLTADAYRIYPRRPGVYFADGIAETSLETTFNYQPTVELTYGTSVVIDSEANSTGARTGFGLWYPHTVLMFHVTAADLAGASAPYLRMTVSSTGSGTGAAFDCTGAELTVTWIADEVI